MTRGDGATPATAAAAISGGLGDAAEEEREEDPIHASLQARWEETQAKLQALFDTDGLAPRASKTPERGDMPIDTGAEESAKTSAVPKKAARQIDDDYGDDDDEDEEEDQDKESPLRAKGKAALPNGVSPHAIRTIAPTSKPATPKHSTSSLSSTLR